MKDYGAGEWYTLPQIRASIARAKLPVEFSAIGMAQYLPQLTFETDIETVFSYDFLRAKFKSYTPQRVLSEQISPIAESSGV